MNRLRQKTTKGYIEWASEKASILNGDETDDRGECDHPLFTYRVRDTYDSTIIRQPNRYGFNSSTFGSNTLISDDCYHYSMEPGVTLFLMNVAEQCPSNLIEEHTAKEIWMYID